MSRHDEHGHEEWAEDTTRRLPTSSGGGEGRWRPDEGATERLPRRPEEFGPDPEATAVLPVVPGPGDHPGDDAVWSDEDDGWGEPIDAGTRRSSWDQPEQEWTEPCDPRGRGRAGWIVAVVLLGLAVLVLLALLLGGQDPPEPATEPTTDVTPTEPATEPSEEATEDPTSRDGVLDRLKESLPSDAPTELPHVLPSDLPTELPTDLPSGLPTGLPTELPDELTGGADGVEQRLQDVWDGLTGAVEDATAGR